MSLFTNATTHLIVKFINCELIFGRSLSLSGALCKHQRMEVSSLKVIFKDRKCQPNFNMSQRKKQGEIWKETYLTDSVKQQ